jgi:hypothetical protein
MAKTSGKETPGGIDDYEREKVESTITDLETIASMLRRYLVAGDKVVEAGGRVPKLPGVDFSTIREPGSFAGPDGPLQTLRHQAVDSSLAVQRAGGEAGIPENDMVEGTERKVIHSKVLAVLTGPDDLDAVRREAIRGAVE